MSRSLTREEKTMKLRDLVLMCIFYILMHIVALIVYIPLLEAIGYPKNINDPKFLAVIILAGEFATLCTIYYASRNHSHQESRGQNI